MFGCTGAPRPAPRAGSATRTSGSSARCSASSLTATYALEALVEREVHGRHAALAQAAVDAVAPADRDRAHWPLRRRRSASGCPAAAARSAGRPRGARGVAAAASAAGDGLRRWSSSLAAARAPPSPAGRRARSTPSWRRCRAVLVGRRRWSCWWWSCCSSACWWSCSSWCSSARRRGAGAGSCSCWREPLDTLALALCGPAGRALVQVALLDVDAAPRAICAAARCRRSSGASSRSLCAAAIAAWAPAQSPAATACVDLLRGRPQRPALPAGSAPLLRSAGGERAASGRRAQRRGDAARAHWPYSSRSASESGRRAARIASAAPAMS